MTGYTREQFGQAWSDDVTVAFGHNGCDTRNDILRRDLRNTTLKADTNGCVVLTGSFTEPYSGQAVSFTRGAGTSSLVQIDHVVALADAWQSGAQQWSADTRRDYANDPLVLLAADGHFNQQKGAANTASWLPPRKSFRCRYVARQVAIKAKYHLWVTAPERDAIARVLAACPGQSLPSDASASVMPKPAAHPAPVRTPTPAPSRQPASAPAPAAVPTREPAGEVYYKNCTAVRAAGAAPIYVGEPGTPASLTATATASPASRPPALNTAGGDVPGVGEDGSGQRQCPDMNLSAAPHTWCLPVGTATGKGHDSMPHKGRYALTGGSPYPALVASAKARPYGRCQAGLFAHTSR